MWRRGGGGRGQAGAVAAQCDMACALGGRGGWGANSRRKDRGENICGLLEKGKGGFGNSFCEVRRTWAAQQNGTKRINKKYPGPCSFLMTSTGWVGLGGVLARSLGAGRLETGSARSVSPGVRGGSCAFDCPWVRRAGSSRWVGLAPWPLKDVRECEAACLFGGRARYCISKYGRCGGPWPRAA